MYQLNIMTENVHLFVCNPLVQKHYSQRCLVMILRENRFQSKVYCLTIDYKFTHSKIRFEKFLVT